MDKEEDKFSKLPDDVLLRILSFVQMKNVVGTSILSKRWRNLWKYVPVLDFGKTVCDSNELKKLLDFVNEVLCEREAIDVQMFNLQIDTVAYKDDFGDDFSRWISILKKLNVQEISLNFNAFGTFMLPKKLFSCRSLKILKLNLWDFCNFPTNTYLPCLKILQLKNPNFNDDSEMLLSGYLVLEELIIKNGYIDVDKFTISAPTLKILKVSATFGRKFMCQVKMNAPNLVSLAWKTSGIWNPDNLQFHCPSLVKADISVAKAGNQELAAKFFRQLFNVQVFKISSSTIENILEVQDGVSQLPVYRHLKHLEVTTSFRVSSHKLRLLQLIQASPNLEIIIFAKGFRNNRRMCRTVLDYTSLLDLECNHCLLHLKIVEIREFTGTKIEIDVVEFFLKNAVVLERTVIKTSNKLSKDLKSRTKVMEQLRMVPSKKIIIQFF